MPHFNTFWTCNVTPPFFLYFKGIRYITKSVYKQIVLNLQYMISEWNGPRVSQKKISQGLKKFSFTIYKINKDVAKQNAFLCRILAFMPL